MRGFFLIREQSEEAELVCLQIKSSEKKLGKLVGGLEGNLKVFKTRLGFFSHTLAGGGKERNKVTIAHY